MATEMEQWRNDLLDTVARRQSDIVRLWDYYRGDHPLPWAPQQIRDAYRAYLRMSRCNWCKLVVKAPSERLRVMGLRFSSSDGGDTKAWERHWQGNRLDAESRLVHIAALVARRGFVLVWPTPGGGPPSITAEDASQVAVAYEPGSRWVRAAAVKTFVNRRAKRAYATVWTPDQVNQWWAELTTPMSPDAKVSLAKTNWQPWDDPDNGIVAEADNPLGTVPMVEFVADPSLRAEPLGELDGGVTDIQDRINKTILDRVVTSNFQSFRQRWAIGLEIPQDDQGNDVEPFRMAVDRLLTSENPDTRFGEFAEAPLDGYLKAVESDIQHLAAITRTPPHYLLGQSGAFPSGESLKATETGLVAKVMELRDSFTESWEEVMRLALRADQDERADDMALSMIWKDPESRTIAEVVDAAVKLDAIGVPWREVMSFIGYSPTDVDRLEQERDEEAATALLSAPVVPGLPTAAALAAPAPPGRPRAPLSGAEAPPAVAAPA